MNDNNRNRYPPGIGRGRGYGGNPNFQPANYYPQQQQQQQYVQRGMVQNHQQQQHHQQQMQQHQQQMQQQQWLRRNQLGRDVSESSVDEVEKTVQSEAIDTSSHEWKGKVEATTTRYTI